MRAFLLPASAFLLACSGLFPAEDKSEDTGGGRGACDKRFFRDQDGDGYGDPSRPEKACEAPDGYVADDTDCDDEDPGVHPGAVEVCDPVHADEDCNGKADEEDEGVELTVFYADDDGDGYGDPDATKRSCEAPDGYVDNADDCDDTDADINPDGREVCDEDGADEDCDGLVNDDDDSMATSGLGRWYEDNDNDGYGTGAAVTACDPGRGWAQENGDCDDDDRSVNPGEEEVCNDGKDNDCDGTDNGCSFEGSFKADDADISVEGTASGDGCGQVAGVGDQDGDGADDLLVGCYGAGSYGGAYLFFGPSGDTDISKADVDFRATSGASFGWFVTGGWDWNDDGDPDILIGDPYRNNGGSTNGGGIYLYYGPVTSDQTEASADVSKTGSTYDYIGFDAKGADWDGDGADDLFYDYDDVVYGVLGPVRGSLSQDVSFSQSSTLTAYEFGDVDGDGNDDLLIGGGWQNSYTGTTWYMESTGRTGSFNASSSSSSYFYGESTSDYAGSALALCDLDDDGHKDAVIGAPGADGAKSESGVVYVFDGPLTANGQSVASADAILEGATTDDQFGAVLSCAGDIDGDGNEDLVVDAPYATGGADDSGTVWVYFGPLSGTVTTSAADATVKGKGEDDLPYWAQGVGDVNGDGADDVGIGSRYNNDGASDAGKVWVFEGGGI